MTAMSGEGQGAIKEEQKEKSRGSEEFMQKPSLKQHSKEPAKAASLNESPAATELLQPPVLPLRLCTTCAAC